MSKYILLFLLLTGCTSDPLLLHEVATTEKAPADGLMTTSPTGSGPTELLAEHGDLHLKLSFLADEAAAADLMIQGRYRLELPQVKLNGAEPEKTVVPAPGVWQDLEVLFVNDKDGLPAFFRAVYLNGNLLYYQQPAVAEPGKEKGPITLTQKKGSVKIADLRTANRAGSGSFLSPEGKVMLQLPLLSYTYYNLTKEAPGLPEWSKLTPGKQGYIGRFDLNRIREDGNNNYGIRFAGDLEIPWAGSYEFSVASTAAVDLLIDGKPVISNLSEQSTTNSSGTIELSEGSHQLQLDLVQRQGRNRLMVNFTAPGSEAPAPLNSMVRDGFVYTVSNKAPHVLEAEKEPYLLRSFVYFPTPKPYELAGKRTHVISVGEQDGPHYSLDLGNGGLLWAWRGQFADIGNMWDGRGPAQVMNPLSTTLAFSGAPQWAELADESTPWPAYKPEDDGIRHQRYTLDGAGRPTFEYEVGSGHAVTDKITPEGNGLLRELTHTASGSATLFTLLASAREITEIAPGVYQLREPGLQLKITSYDGDNLVLQRGEGIQRLIAELPAKGQLTYRIDW